MFFALTILVVLLVVVAVTVFVKRRIDRDLIESNEPKNLMDTHLRPLFEADEEPVRELDDALAQQKTGKAARFAEINAGTAETAHYEELARQAEEQQKQRCPQQMPSHSDASSAQKGTRLKAYCVRPAAGQRSRLRRTTKGEEGTFEEMPAT